MPNMNYKLIHEIAGRCKYTNGDLIPGLEKARALLAKGWCRQAYAKDADGEIVSEWSQEAVQWDISGALKASCTLPHVMCYLEKEDRYIYGSRNWDLYHATMHEVEKTLAVYNNIWNDDICKSREQAADAMTQTIKRLHDLGVKKSGGQCQKLK